MDHSDWLTEVLIILSTASFVVLVAMLARRVRLTVWYSTALIAMWLIPTLLMLLRAGRQ